MKRVLILLVSILVVISMTFIGTGCKEEVAPVEEVAEEAPTEEAAPVEEVAEEAPAEEAAVEYKIACYFPSAHPYFESVKKGILKFEEDFGIEVYIQLGTDWTQDTMNIFVEGLVAEGYNALFVLALDAGGANSLFEEVIEQGVFVINYGTTVLEPTPASFNLATDVKAAAMASTEKVVEAMGEEGGLLNILEYVEDPNTILRKEGVEEVVAKYPDVEVVQTIGDMSAIEECTEKISNAMAGLGDQVNGMVTTGYNPTVACAQILAEIENDKIAYVGIDDDPIVLKAIEDGYVTGTFGQNPYLQGYASPYLLKLLLDGHQLKEDYFFVDTYGVMITKDNLDTFSDELWQAAYDIVDNAIEDYFIE
jgi:ribose transport system substrate-binding protein